MRIRLGAGFLAFALRTGAGSGLGPAALVVTGAGSGWRTGTVVTGAASGFGWTGAGALGAAGLVVTVGDETAFLMRTCALGLFLGAGFLAFALRTGAGRFSTAGFAGSVMVLTAVVVKRRASGSGLCFPKTPLIASPSTNAAVSASTEAARKPQCVFR